jgi:hypothetical protein
MAAQATSCALARWEGPGVLLVARSRRAGRIAEATSFPAPAAGLALWRGVLWMGGLPVHGDGRRAGYVVVVGRPPVFAMTGPSATAAAHRLAS